MSKTKAQQARELCSRIDDATRILDQGKYQSKTIDTDRVRIIMFLVGAQEGIADEYRKRPKYKTVRRRKQR